MPDQSALSLGGAKTEAVAAKARLAASVLHLFKADGFVPTPTSVLADFVLHECDFDGYAAKTIAAWSDPALAGTGYAVYAPTQSFPWVLAVDAKGNSVGGWFLVLAGGSLYEYGTFDPARPAQGADQVVIVTPTDVYPAGTF